MTRNEIVNDLIRNRPKGPASAKITYEVEEEYCYDASRYKQVATPSHGQYGYTDEDFFDLGFKQRADCDVFIRQRDFNGDSDWKLGRKKATITRRVNRLWSRISDSIRRVTKAGGRGIYKVIDSPYRGGLLGHLYAESKEEATITAKIYFGYLMADSERMGVEYIRRGSVTEMKSLNEKLVVEIDNSMKSLEIERSNLEKRITNLEARKETLATVEAQQTAVEMINTLDAMEG